jgi:LPXTG-motif cell wall-anchored protein
MGGSSLSGYHVLQNSVAFDNKAKGIDSNSCPDNQVYYSTSFNNGGSNVALYTNDSANTDFYAEGILSYRTQYTDVNETFKLKGTQDETKVYQSSDYYWNYTGTGSNNSKDTLSDADFVSVDTHMNYETHVYSEAPVTRNADGTINMNGLLVLSEAGQSIGAGAGSTAATTYMASENAALSTGSELFSLAGLTTTDGLVNKVEKPSTGTPATGTSGASASGSADASTPKTGDTANMMIYVIMLLAAASALAAVFSKKRKDA